MKQDTTMLPAIQKRNIHGAFFVVAVRFVRAVMQCSGVRVRVNEKDFETETT
jgi:hypothetical protein